MITRILFLITVLSLTMSVTWFSVVDAKVLQDKIPSDRLLEKDNNWELKYSNASEFRKIDNAIRAYVDDSHPNNKWNKETKKNEIIIYNFDVLTNQKESGLHVILANVIHQQQNLKYNPTDAERRFHEWAFKKISNPVIPNVKNELIDQVINAYNTNINLGHVPFELITMDQDFWGNVMVDSICEYYIECSSNRTSYNDHELDCVIIPCVDAWHESAWHILHITVDPYSCYEGTGCLYSDMETGTGTLGAHAGGQKHANTPTLKYTISLSTSSNENVYLVATGNLSVGSGTESIDPVYGWNAVHTYETEYVDGVTCGSEHCGTYSLTVESNSYIGH